MALRIDISQAKAAALTAEQTAEQRKMDEAAAEEKAKMWGIIGGIA